MQMAKHRVITLKERLHEAGLRATPGRLALAVYFERKHQPVGTPELSKQFVPRVFDLATLYRTLAAFEEKQLIRSTPIDARFASYEWVEDASQHHHHLVCVACGLIEEIPPCDLESMEKKVLAKAPRFSRVTSHSLEFFGTCRTCDKP